MIEKNLSLTLSSHFFKKWLLIFVFFTIFNFSHTLFANTKDFQILYPLNNSVYNEEFATISLKVDPKKIKGFKVLTQLDTSIEVKTSSKKEIYCKTIPLKLGINEIKIKLYLNNNLSKEYKLKLFYHNEIFEVAEEIPAGFKKIYFHNDIYENLCTKCHDMRPDFKLKTVKLEAKGSATTDMYILENPQDSNCYTCHNKLASRKNGHAPAVNFMCQICHNGQTGENNLEEEGKSRYLYPDPIIKVCFTCHKRIEHIIEKNYSDHGPTNSGRCNLCHNPHSSKNIFFLKKSIWNLCTTCHAEKASGLHVIASFVYQRNKGGHPTKDRKDPSRPGRELVCSSCHDPHGSKGPFLLRTTGKIPFSICKRCHKK
ncbi:cytochrome c3 family protein [Nitrosophilus labii]|uniref:cytochrome c3 family protein n=1 Tax=Nitrosophilus labii TaxID=2706014 RepID=UPI00165718D2|nr:cytochrome c3 family protein [Nitrosophilus labii]